MDRNKASSEDAISGEANLLKAHKGRQDVNARVDQCHQSAYQAPISENRQDVNMVVEPSRLSGKEDVLESSAMENRKEDCVLDNLSSQQVSATPKASLYFQKGTGNEERRDERDEFNHKILSKTASATLKASPYFQKLLVNGERRDERDVLHRKIRSKTTLKVEIPVFVETNLGTRIAISISQDITVANLKSEAELPFLPPTRFILFEGSFSERVETKSLCLQRSERKGYYPQKVDETPCESSSGGISVGGIIDKYFTDFIDVGQVRSALCSEASMRYGQNLQKGQFVKKPPFSELTNEEQESLNKTSQRTSQRILCSPLPQELSSVGVRRYKRSEVGKRLITASNSLGRCQNAHRSTSSKSKRLRDADASSIVRSLVFEIGDSD